MLEAISRACNERWAELEPLFSELRIEHLVDPAGLKAALSRLRYGLATDPFVLHALALELWLRHQDSTPEVAAG